MWTEYNKFNLNKDGFYHIDTRDFSFLYLDVCAVTNDYDFSKFDRFKSNHNEEELIESINRIYVESGENKNFRHLNLHGFKSEGWLKYIRIYKHNNIIRVYTHLGNGSYGGGIYKEIGIYDLKRALDMPKIK